MKVKLIDFGYKKAPKRMHYNDAGADVYSPTKFVAFAQSTTKVGLGFGVEIPDGYVGYIFPRSGLSANGIVCELPPIDSGYRGEVHAIVTNNTSNSYQIKEGDRIGQLVIMPVILAEYVTELNDDRGDNGFASTDKKEI